MAEAQQTHPHAESATDLLREIASRVRLPQGRTAEDAVRAVMCTIFRHPAAEEARDFFAALPKQAQPLIGVCPEHRRAAPVRFDRDELALRVGQHLHTSRGDGEDIASAVLTALSARLPGGRVANVAARLPAGIRPLWVARRVPLPSDPHPIIRWIEASGPMPEGVDGVAAFSTVMGLLTRRLSRGEARHLAAELPRDLAPLISDYIEDRQERAARFDHEEYLNLVARELDTDDVDEAEHLARVVFSALQEYLRSDVCDHMLRQLPEPLQELWEV